MNSIVRIVCFSVVILAFSCNEDKPGDPFASERRPSREIIEGIELKEKIADKESTYSDILATLEPYSPFLTRSKMVKDFDFEVKYQPHLYLAITHGDSVNADDRIDHKTLEKVKDYSNLHYIQFSMENTKFKSELLRFDLESAQEYSDRIMYYSFYSNRDAYIIENGTDTLRGSFVHFERTFDVSPKLNMTFVFERKSIKPVTNLSFVFDDVIFNNGRLNFEFDYPTISVLNAIEVKKLLL